MEVSHSRLVSKSPIFYGWIIMLIGTLGMIMSSPGQTYVVSIFIEPFIADLGISRSLVSTLYTLGTLVGSFVLPIVGYQIDRHGARLIVAIVIVLFGLACVYMGYVQNAFMLGLGFIALRMLGQGSLGMGCTNLINQWWVRRRGMVMGISGMAGSLISLGGFPNLVNWLLPIYGWRSTYILLGLILTFVMAPVAFIFFRNQPEDYGLQPDGGESTTFKFRKTRQTSVGWTEVHWTLGEAMRTSVFWILVASLSAISMLSTGLFFHMVSIFTDNGLTPNLAAAVFVPIAVTTAIVNWGSGLLVDRVPLRILLTIGLLFQAVSLLMACSLSGITLALLFGVVLGISSGLIRILGSVVWAVYFGRHHLGSITGFTSMITIIGSAMGPMPLGIGRDLLGSYNLALIISAAIPLLLGILGLFIEDPARLGQRLKEHNQETDQ
jgi:MFS family permease